LVMRLLSWRAGISGAGGLFRRGGGEPKTPPAGRPPPLQETKTD